jgi:hypothetical protein
MHITSNLWMRIYIDVCIFPDSSPLKIEVDRKILSYEYAYILYIYRFVIIDMICM